jgi:uroporphyrinogen-III decarboxylase
MKTISSSQWYETFSREWFRVITSAVSDLGVVYSQLPAWAEASLILAPIASLTVGILYSISLPAEDYRSGMEPYLRGNYDPVQARVFYSRHKLLVLQRVLQMLRLSNRFIFNLVLDLYVFKSEERNRSKRADELLVLITQLGPTAIKSTC